MAADNEKLYVVAAAPKNKPTLITRLKVFRTRDKARTFARNKNKNALKLHYRVLPASWGPEK